MSTQPKILMRLRDVVSWLEPMGITSCMVRRAIERKILTGKKPFGPNSKAFYRRDDVERTFNLR